MTTFSSRELSLFFPTLVQPNEKMFDKYSISGASSNIKNLCTTMGKLQPFEMTE